MTACAIGTWVYVHGRINPLWVSLYRHRRQSCSFYIFLLFRKSREGVGSALFIGVRSCKHGSPSAEMEVLTLSLGCVAAGIAGHNRTGDSREPRITESTLLTSRSFELVYQPLLLRFRYK